MYAAILFPLYHHYYISSDCSLSIVDRHDGNANCIRRTILRFHRIRTCSYNRYKIYSLRLSSSQLSIRSIKI